MLPPIKCNTECITMIIIILFIISSVENTFFVLLFFLKIQLNNIIYIRTSARAFAVVTSALLPYLKVKKKRFFNIQLIVLCLGLVDEQQRVRIITALAGAAVPYGIELFDTVIQPLLNGVREHRGKVRILLFIKKDIFLHRSI